MTTSKSKSSPGKTLFRLTALAFLAAIASHPSIASAQLLAQEEFTYDTTAVTGFSTVGTAQDTLFNPGGDFSTLGWQVKSAGSLGTQSQVTSPGLTYTDGSHTLVTSGNAVSLSTGTGNQLLFNSTLGIISGATATPGSGTLWMSFLWQGLNTSANGSLFRQASVGFYSGATAGANGGSEYFDIGMPNISSANVGTVNPVVSYWYGGHGPAGQTGSSLAPNYQSSVAANGGNTALVVLELQMDNVSTTGDTMTMWVNPTLGGGTPVGTSYTYNLQDLSSLNAIRLAASGLNTTYGPVGGEMAVDEIRLGDTFGDVAPVPEPATMALAGLGGLALLALKRQVRK